MQDLYELFARHRSIRQFRPDPVDPDVLERMLNRAIAGASSSGNMQTFSVVVTRDQELREKLHPLHFHQDMVLEAPVLLTFCADFHRMRCWLAQREAPDNFDNFMSFMIGAIDAVIVAQNVALAAEAEGLGICYMGTTLANCQAIGEVLQLPPNVVPVVGFVLGHPAEAPAKRDRLPLAGLVHDEVYHAADAAEIATVYRDREAAGWQRYMADQRLREAVEAAGVSNLAQVYTTVKYTRASHLEYSRTVLGCLERQGFLNHQEAG